MAETQNLFFDMTHRGDAVLCADALACWRGGRQIFDDISFTLKAGDAVMIAGPNGSGKSSLLRQIAGLLPVEAGKIGGAEARQTHYLGHEDGLKTALTVGETLAFEARVAGRPNATAADIGKNLGLKGRDWQFIGDLSAGLKRRLSLARLLLDPRPLWLLDEPFTALDADGRKLVSQMAAAHMAAGGMILAASHEKLDFAARQINLAAAS